MAKSIKTTSVANVDAGVKIQPRLPRLDGIFDLGANELVVSHSPHDHIQEHLHDHLPHMHIRYGFEIPAQSFDGVTETALEVAMMINVRHRVDCNPVFVARGSGAEGICLKIAGEDMHWVHSDAVGKKAAEKFQASGRKIPAGFRFSGFQTSNLTEQRVRRFTKNELKAAVGLGLRCDQHFQATWIDPNNEAIEPYDVIIFLSNDEGGFHTFFRLQPTISLGAC